ncbi:unnamed protein product, partial [Brassica rapa]
RFTTTHQKSRRVKYFEIQPESHGPFSMVWLCRWKSCDGNGTMHINILDS